MNFRIELFNFIEKFIGILMGIVLDL
jgi:hypothetical protein